MATLDERTITAAVNDRLEGCTSPRLKQVMASLTAHLHDFVRDVHLTETEWRAAIEFLTATGQKCGPTRQEYILLSDVLGVSTLCVALNSRKAEGATEATVLGPFHVPGASDFALGDDISQGASGAACIVRGTVRGTDGRPVPHAQLEVWHADDEGLYDVQRSGEEMTCRARLQADEHGVFHFRTVKPVAYPIPGDGPVGAMLAALGRHPWRPAHIHFMVRAPGYEELVTQIFERGDAYIDTDAVFGVRASLLGDFKLHPAGEEMDAPFYTLDADLVLSKPGEG